MTDNKEYKGFLINGKVYVSDSDSMRIGEVEVEQIPVIIEKDLIKFWITNCGLLDELGLNATVWD